MIKLDQVTKTYGTGVSALKDITLGIEKGEFVFVVGPSGSGKTTLFRLLTREMLPTQGTIVVNEWDITRLPKNKIPHLRKKIGVVFQDLKLLMDRTILENVLLPLEMSNVEHNEAVQRVEEVLRQVGILEHKDKFPIQLSGGELQRTAIARALVFGPDILLADEPTGNLDSNTSWEIVKLLQDINKSGTTILMATHNTDIVNSLLKRIIALEKGIIIKDEKKAHTGQSAEPAPAVKKEETPAHHEATKDEKVDHHKKEHKPDVKPEEKEDK